LPVAGGRRKLSPKPMIQALQINHYRNHVGTRFEFGRFTLLAGPNGVGKSNVLRCLARFDREGEPSAFAHQSVDNLDDEDLILTVASGGRIWKAATSNWSSEHADSIVYTCEDRSIYREQVVEAWTEAINPSASLSPAVLSQFFYLKPQLNHLSSPHFSDSAKPALRSDGLGLASVLAYLMTSAPERFAAIQAALKDVVPQVVRIRAAREMVEVPELQTVTVKSREIAYTETREMPGDALLFDMKNAEGLTAREVSDGTLVVLALLTAIHQEPQPRVLLIDDIETGLHPAAQESLMKQIRRLLDQIPELQVVATTHSPFVIDQCSPDEVWLLSSDAKGHCHAAQMSRHPQADAALKILTTGEFWTAEGEEWVLPREEAPKPAAPAHAG